MRTCVIFNPMARGHKARHFRTWLEEISGECALKPTQCAGDARRLAAEAIGEGFELVVAAGGDGTANEVVNGIADAPDGFSRVCLGILPLGTVNVLARELKLPKRTADNWPVLKAGKTTSIDVPYAEFTESGKIVRRYFIQMGGSGLDARAIELVSWQLKKKIGPIAYIVAGFKALFERKPTIYVSAGDQKCSGELILIGNGGRYGGEFQIFPGANWKDRRLDACIFPRTNLGTLIGIFPKLLLQHRLPEKAVKRISAGELRLTSDWPSGFELDGEWVGHLPVTFAIHPQKLRIVIP